MDYFSSSASSSSSSSSLANGKPKKNPGKRSSNGVKLSTDPQSVAARERRHRISDKFKILQSLVPGGSKMDTVSLLEEAINYVKFLKAQILLHQTIMNVKDDHDSNFSYLPLPADPDPNPLQEQQFTLLNANFVAEMEPSVSVPFQDSYFTSEEASAMYDHHFHYN